MPIKKCKFGFDCASMMLQPGLLAEDCPNNHVCGLLKRLSPEQEVEIIRVREVQRRRRRNAVVNYIREPERIRVNQYQATAMRLKQKGSNQTPQSLGLTDLLNRIEEASREVREQLDEYEGELIYVAPEGVEVHAYKPKKPNKPYCYNKLSSKSAIFGFPNQNPKVTVIHLGKDGSGLHLLAQVGIERRNKLTQARTQLQTAETALRKAIELLQPD